MNLATIIVLLVVAALVVVDVIALRRGKGRCRCSGNAKPHEGCNKCTGCTASCPLKR